MIRTIGVLGLLAVIALCAGAAGAAEHNIWVSVDGNSPPGWFVPEYDTFFLWDAIDYINTYKLGNNSTDYADSFYVLVDDGVYYECLSDAAYMPNMIHNLTIKSVSGDPTKCIVDNGSPPGEDYAPGAPAYVMIMRSCHNFLMEGITLRGSELYDVVHPDIANRYPRKTFNNYVEINGAGDAFDVYDSSGNHLAGPYPLGRATGDGIELPQPAGVGLGATSDYNAVTYTRDPGYLDVLSGAAGDRAWFHVTTFGNALDGFMGPFQDDIVAGDVDLHIHTGDYGIHNADGGAKALYAYGGTGGSGDGYVPGWYQKGTIRNCNFETCKNGIQIIQACALNGGPGGDEVGWITVEGCNIVDIQGWDGFYIGTANIDVIDCSLDTVGGHWIYSDWTGTVAMPEVGNAMPIFGSRDDFVQGIGPLTVNITNTSFKDVELIDIGWANVGIALHYWDSDPYWNGYDPANDAAQPWGTGACNLTVDGCLFDDNWRDIWVCDSHNRLGMPVEEGDIWTEVHIQNTTFINSLSTALWGMANGQTIYFDNNSCIKYRGVAYPYYDVTENADRDCNICTGGDGWENGGPSGPGPSSQYYVSNCYFQGARLGVLHEQYGNVLWTNNTVVDGGIYADFWTGGFWSDCGVYGFCEIDNLWVIDSIAQGISSAYWQTDGTHEVRNLLVTGSFFNGLWADSTNFWELDHCTIAHCEPTQWGDGIACSEAWVILNNSIVAFNPEYGVVVWDGGIVDVYYSCLYGNGFQDGGAYTDWGPGANDLVGNIVADPMFAGADPDDPKIMLAKCWDLSPGSPCIGTDEVGGDMGAIPYGQHEMTVEIDLPEGQSWLGIPVCPYEKDVGASLPQSVPGETIVSISKYDNTAKTWLPYPDEFTNYGPGDMLWVFITNKLGGRAVYPVSITGVPVRTSVAIDLMSAGGAYIANPFEIQYNLNNVRVEKMSNVSGRWRVIEGRTMLEDFNHPTDRWIDWHWSFYHDFGIDYFDQPDANNNWLTPWQGYYMWVNVSALSPGTEKLQLQFFRDPKGAITY